MSFFVFLIDAKPPPKAVNCSGNVATFAMLLLQNYDAFEEELNIEVECGEVQGGVRTVVAQEFCQKGSERTTYG